MNRFADLHIHTLFSDGQYSPTNVVEKAKEIGFSAISITDHDTFDGIEEAVSVGDKLGIEVIPGIEISTVWDKKEIHILGYFCNQNNYNLQNKLKVMQSARRDRMEKIVFILNKLNYKINYEEIIKLSGNGSVGRPHIARLLVEKGYIRSVKEAFNQLLSPGCPAYVERYKITPQEALDLILKAQGIPIIAHPGILNDDDIIPQLVNLGLMGIEVWHPDHTKKMSKKYASIAKKHDLLLTGGSDWHGKNKDASFMLGNIKLDYKYVEELKMANF
ncbi:hypothetical protein SAMN00017405_1486 [Desulfonispora thiosulfatigenes DSM 11270]|uniref:Polymerase/histidinol phosphatase N-terminal domain-containing protein n=1 Tax=Desulfonispora thiosulfatigenes DSM 11270 TaxID=656914 RepID=A0A1W1VSD8_DESTI|nr:PHP domain-containing protein [Desulfonispora thiosulfatigenes]SMB96256.1 hypothetical protein SAMN00017405_1486 [Desulfonispora thiosulfatigenes DSM 11270]